METVTTENTNHNQEHNSVDNVQTSVSINAQVAGNVMKLDQPEKIHDESLKTTDKVQDTEDILKEPLSVSTVVKKIAALPQNTCKSTSCVCNNVALKGFEFCHKHILEDKTSPYKRCNFVNKLNNERCSNPAPKLGKTFCILNIIYLFFYSVFVVSTIEYIFVLA